MSPETVRQVCFEQLEPLTLESVQQKIAEFEPRQWQIDIVCPAILKGLTDAAAPDAGMPAEKSVTETTEDA
jgi:hypothetical protein